MSLISFDKFVHFCSTKGKSPLASRKPALGQREVIILPDIFHMRPLEQGFLGNRYHGNANQALKTFESVALTG